MDTGHLDKTKTLSERINGEQPIGFKVADPRACMTCINSNGEPPWADSPMKNYCLAYPREEGERKPPSVYYDGGPCRFHRPAR